MSLQVAVQLIIFGERPKNDLAGVLREVEEAGYAGFEGGAPGSAVEESAIRRAMQGRQVRYIGGHTGINNLEEPGYVKTAATAVSALGGKYIMVSGGYDTLEGYREGVKILNQAGAICKGRGVTLCYHNHYWEFTPMEGQVPIHVLAEETDAEVVSLCPDIYWIHVGGERPAEFLARYAVRIPCVHFKDGLAGDNFQEFRELGQGVVDIPAALEATKNAGAEWVIVEQDSTQREPIESNRMSREYLKSLGC